MSYEYKELIKTYTEYIMDDYEVVDYIEAGKELDHVYRRAAKADEYEAKEKAWDALMAEIDRITDEASVKGLPPKTTLVNKVIAVTMAKKKCESGDYDA